MTSDEKSRVRVDTHKKSTDEGVSQVLNIKSDDGKFMEVMKMGSGGYRGKIHLPEDDLVTTIKNMELSDAGVNQIKFGDVEEQDFSMV